MEKNRKWERAQDIGTGTRGTFRYNYGYEKGRRLSATEGVSEFEIGRRPKPGHVGFRTVCREGLRESRVLVFVRVSRGLGVTKGRL